MKKYSCFFDLCASMMEPIAKDAVVTSCTEDPADLILKRLIKLGLARGSTDRNVSAVGLVTSAVRALPPRLETVLNPASVRRKRTQNGLALEEFAKRNPDYAYYIAVATIGTRCSVENVEEAVDLILDPVRRINQRPTFQASGTKILLRAVEIATPGPIEQAPAQRTFHTHCHLLFGKKRNKTEIDAREIWEELNQIFPGVCLAERIPDSQALGQVVRYFLKEPKFDSCTDRELRILFQTLRGKRLVQALGPLREFIANIKKSGVRLYRDGTGTIICAPKVARKTVRHKSKKRKGLDKRVRDPNKVVALIPPCRLASQFREPVLLVENFDKDPGELIASVPFFQELRETCRRKAGLSQ